MPIGIEHLINYGVLGIFVLYVLWAIWKVGSKGGAKAVELGERYVTSTEVLHDTLKESAGKQRELCAAHTAAMALMTESLERQVEVATKSCAHLESLDRAHGSEWTDTMQVIHDNSRDLQRVKHAALRACEMCRHLTAAEFPNSADKVAQHCNEIERIIGEA